MWEPVGPLPASVYWRRRAAAVAAAVATLLLAAWCVASLLTPARPETSASLAANSVSLSSAPQPDTSSPIATGIASGTTDPALPSVPPPPGVAAQVSLPPGPSSTGPSSTGPPPTVPSPAPSVQQATSAVATPEAASESLRADATAGRTVPVATPVPVPPSGPVPCTNEMLTVTAEVGLPAYEVGQRPVFRLVITNSSGQPCVRDLDNSRQEVVVWNDDRSARLWSSNDCSNLGRPDLRTLVPGQPVVSSVTWAGRTSAPKCAAPRTTVPAGSYRLMARLDDDISPAVPFTLTP